MRLTQVLSFIKKPAFILILIIFVFFLKGVFLAGLFPFLHGQDENVHYNTVQYLAEPKEKTWQINFNKKQGKKSEMGNYFNFTEEIEKTAEILDYDNLRHKLNNTQNFSQNYFGSKEEIIMSSNFKRYNEDYPPSMVTETRLYHSVASLIEKLLYEENILVRFFSIRIYSVMLGSLAILFFCFILKNIGFSPKNSLLLTAIMAFQPMFSRTSSYVTYDIFLIFAFSVFTFAGVLIIKNGANWKNTAMLIASVAAGLLAKPTALALVGASFFLAFYAAYQKSRSKKIFFKRTVFVFLVCAVITSFIIANYFNLSDFLAQKNYNNTGEFVKSLDKYIDKSFGTGRMKITSKTYWGNIGWSSREIADNITSAIWIIQAISAIGLLSFFIFKKREFLPEKKYIIFFLIMILALQFGVRFADWTVYEKLGRIELGAPGRYFLPNFISHMVLAAAGIGFILRKEKFLEIFLTLALIAMFAFSIYSIFIEIIPRYYL